ncbi:MAG: hypothetical protein ABJF88_15965 [Rhodothermales bacterium]
MAPDLPPGVQSVVTAVSSLFDALNTGLLIYHLVVPEETSSLTLVYANAVASRYTGTDLDLLVGQTIDEAFPALRGTDLPQTYADVSLGDPSVNLGSFEYEGDERVQRGYFAVKAFPMPERCVGVVFENITLRKKIEQLLRRERNRRPPPEPG